MLTLTTQREFCGDSPLRRVPSEATSAAANPTILHTQQSDESSSKKGVVGTGTDALPRRPRLLYFLLTLGALAACSTTTPPARAPSAARSDASTSAPTVMQSSTVEPTATIESPASVDLPGTTERVTSTEATPMSDSIPDECLGSLSQRQKVALLVWPAIYSDDWASAERVVRDDGIGGVLLMQPKLTEQQLRANIAELDNASRLGVLVATDEEGGTVQRLSDIKSLPSQRDISRLLTPADTEPVIAKHAALLDRIGIDVVLGPVVDVAPADSAPALQRSRMFEGDANAVAEYGRAYVLGWTSAGLLPTLKHYPGHGAASGDTHLVDAVTPDLSVLVDRDLVPYRALADLQPAVLVGHLTVPGLTDGAPATASDDAVAYLRDELGYGDALVISDALDMAAADAPVPRAAVDAIRAGIDVVLVMDTNVVPAVIDRVIAAVDDGTFPAARVDAAAKRVLRQLTQRGGGCRGTATGDNDEMPPRDGGAVRRRSGRPALPRCCRR